MSTARLQLLPFEQLDHEQFESFLLQFLGAGISLEVIERPLAFTPVPPEQTAPPAPASFTARYRLVRATSVGTSGQKQHGIDLIAYTESGAQWVFQCKHWPKKKFDVAAAEEVIAKANTEYPEARRYFAVLSHPPTRPVDVHRVFDAAPRWELWEPSELSTRFFNEVPRDKQPDLVRRFFGEETVRQLFPDQSDALLLPASAFFARSSPINFATAFVGREPELTQLLAFARSPGPAATILSAPGGIGKTRLLREFAERLAAESPDLRVLFLNPYANAQANTDTLRIAEEGKLIVVFDDAHRSETLPDDIADSVAAKKGRLLLAARPQSVETLRNWSADHGFPTNEPIRLPPLDDALLQRLAATELGPDLASHAGRIVSLADHNALLVTVAAGLLKQEPLSSIGALLASEDFGRHILDRLANKTLKSAFPDHTQRERARDVLHILAILAPWTEEVLPLDRIAALLGCGEREFNRVRDALLAAKLLVHTARGLRVVPDLLADHLVRQACFEPGSERRLTSLAVAIQKEFAPNISCTSALHVIRNLAEAEAQQGLPDGELVEPFWREFRRQYLEAKHFIRAHLLHEWSSFAIHQPQRSLILARLAVETAATPGTVGVAPDEILESLSPATTGRVLAATAALLEPIAAHCPKQRQESINLLWELDRQTSASVAPSTSSALDALGHLANWESHQHLDAVRDLLSWLASRLRSADGVERLLLRRSPALSVLLKPVFECSYDWIESAPGSTEARLVALPESDTEPLYATALDLIEQSVLPKGEVAHLNVHGVLESALAASPHHGRWRTMPEPSRLRALRLVATLLHEQTSPRVVFRFRDTLRGILTREPQGEFRDKVRAILDSLPVTSSVRLAIVLLSNRWKEFYHHLPREERVEAREEHVAEGAWAKLTESVAREFLETSPDEPSHLAEFERIASEYRAVGETPEFAELFEALTRADTSRAWALLNAAIARPQTPFDRSLLSLVDYRHPAGSVEGLADRILAMPNHERWASFLVWLGWRGREVVTAELLAHFAKWAATLDDDGLRAVLPHLALSRSPFPGIGETILEHLPLSELEGSSIDSLVQRLDDLRFEPESFSLSPNVRVRLLAELDRAHEFDTRDGHSCLLYLAEQEPRRFYEMLVRRLQRAPASKRGSPFGFNEFVPLTGLTKEPDYPELARGILSEIQRSAQKTERHWRTIFQWSVLRVSPLGLALLGEWLDQTCDAEELHRLIRCLRFDGSTIVFEHPGFVRRVFVRARQIAPAQSDDLRSALADTGGPMAWGYTDGEPDPAARRYREEAAKAAAIHAADPELAAFYRLIVEQEDARFAFSRRPHTSNAEWSYD